MPLIVYTKQGGGKGDYLPLTCEECGERTAYLHWMEGLEQELCRDCRADYLDHLRLKHS